MIICFSTLNVAFESWFKAFTIQWNSSFWIQWTSDEASGKINGRQIKFMKDSFD